MKRNRADNSCLGRFRFIHVVLLVILCFVILMSLEAPALFKPNLIPYSHAALEVIEAGNIDAIRSRVSVMQDASNQHRRFVIPRVSQVGPEIDAKREQSSAIKEEARKLSEKKEHSAHGGTQSPLPDLRTVAAGAWASGAVAWKEMEEAIAGQNSTIRHVKKEGIVENCPKMLLLSGEDLKNAGNIMMLPCGLMSGSSITVIAKPKKGHIKPRPKIARVVDDVKNVIVSQFILELQGLKMVDGEDPPRILHVNPRLKGDWSGRPVIELNTCYRGQWGIAQRCEGWVSSDDEDPVDGLSKCQRWIQNDNDTLEDSKSTWWNKLIGHSAKSSVEWSYPFVEEQLFVLTIRAGWEGYHISADGKHVASFPYRTGFILEEATGFTISGDIDVHSIVATSLPYSHPKFTPEQLIEESETLRALPLPKTLVDLFIGILSASTHFAERMAVRKTWMQSKSIRSSGVVARFFVGMHPHKDINVQVKEEADYFGDMVILPFMDHYDLVVLKTIAICEYGVKNISARHIMKTDDDTFVRVEKILNMVRVARKARGLYMGNINQFHRPLRVGKWAVTYEEWPEEEYPPYANGPGYVISSDIAKFVLSQHENNTLRLFKMEDVSMGMWVVQFNQYYAVHYVHNLKFCQWGCVEDYFTAHYQSPRQMLCMWEKLREGEAQCCNM